LGRATGALRPGGGRQVDVGPARAQHRRANFTHARAAQRRVKLILRPQIVVDEHREVARDRRALARRRLPRICGPSNRAHVWAMYRSRFGPHWDITSPSVGSAGRASLTGGGGTTCLWAPPPAAWIVG